MPLTAREASLKALSAYRRSKKQTDETLAGLTGDLSRPDAALAFRITSGVMQNKALCDYYISHFSSLSESKIHPYVNDILRLSVYQIAFLERVPNSAIVNEAVAMTRKYSNERAVGFVNALLRRIAKAADESKLPEVTGDSLRRLSIKYSHPEYIVSKFIELLGEQETEDLLAINNSPDAPLTAQINTIHAGTDEICNSLEADVVNVWPHSFLSDCVEMRGTGDITKLDAFKRGLIYIQNAAARLAVIAAAPEENSFVIDGCAAPGGKSFAAAIMMKNKGHIESFDRSEDKINKIRTGADRLGLSIINATLQDASRPSAKYLERADTVIADVPCSGFGVIRNKPEIRCKDEHEIAGLQDIQRNILRGLSLCVKPGAVLLYSTCTLLKSENEDNIEWFLSENKQFYTEDFLLPGGTKSSNGMLTLWPHIHGMDGFFICKLRKKL